MNTEIIGKIWDRLEGRQLELMHTFYERLFERYPHYRSLFPPQLDSHMPRMIHTFAMVSRLAEHPDITEAHMYSVGQAHRSYGLGMQDLKQFKEVFLEVLAEFCAGEWTQECIEAWNEVFDTRILPQVMSGLAAPEKAAHSVEGEAPAHWYTYGSTY
jgi:hemoglobin-like flavoprotein